MEWRDDAIVLSVKMLGETSSVLSMLTRGHGRHAGLVRGGASRRARGMLQPGNRVAARWRGRLAEQLGTFVCEPSRVVAPAALADRRQLATLAAACAVADTALPEREPLPRLFERLEDLLAALPADPEWPARYVRWEVALLADLGWGLDLSRCALSGVEQGLAFVSPRTGRAVAAAAGAPWRDRLLLLPAFVVDANAPAGAADIAAGLALTGHFLRRHVYAEQARDLPAARARLPQELARPTRSPADAPAGGEE